MRKLTVCLYVFVYLGSVTSHSYTMLMYAVMFGVILKYVLFLVCMCV